MQPEHRAMYVVGSTSTTRPSSSQDTPRIRVDFSPRIFESNVVARMGERSPFVSSNRKVPRSLVCTFPLVPLAGSAYAATSRITLPQAPTSDVALPLNLPESRKSHHRGVCRVKLREQRPRVREYADDVHSP